MPINIKCLIIDDEPIARRIIRKHLSCFPAFEIIAECESALQALQLLNSNTIDLIFLDIQMPGINGIDFIKTLTKAPKVIFTTAYRDYAVTAFDLNVVDYLLKPISIERFALAINKFLEQNNKTCISKNKAEYILLKADRKHYKILLKDIMYLESMGDYIDVYTKNKKIRTKERISNLECNLPQNDFTRIHRSFIVSNSNIEAIGSGFVEIMGESLPIGRNYKNNIERLLA